MFNRICVRLLAAWFVLVSCSLSTRAGEVDLPRFPSISPDGSTIVFSWRGDLWRTSASGGEAFRLTAHPADETRSAWSPDGSLIAFESNRSGRRAIHTMKPDGSDVQQITTEDASLTLSGFTADGKFVLVSGSIEGDVYRSERPYRASIHGGPIERLHGAFGQAAAAHPDGVRYIFERGGSSWMRRHYRGPDDRNLYLYNSTDGSFARLTNWRGNDGQPVWKDADTIIYMSDLGSGEHGFVNLWAFDLATREPGARPLTAYTDRDITAFDVSRDGRTVVFTKWDGLYVAMFAGEILDQPTRIRVKAPADATPRRETRDVSGDVSEAILSPDGKVMAFVAFGDVYVRAIEEGSPTRQVTQSMARERDIAWSPDMSRLYFVSDRDGSDSIYAATVALTRAEIRERFADATKPAPPVEPALPETTQTDPSAEHTEPADPQASEPAQDPAVEPEPENTETKAAKKTDKPAKPKVAERWHDAIRFDLHPIVTEPTDDRSPTIAPDGLSMIFKRTRGDLVRLDLRTGEQQVLLESWDWSVEPRYSPCGRYFAIAVNDSDFNTDIFIAPVDGSWAPVNITRHPDNDTSPRWSSDGKILAFLSEREGDSYDVYTITLDRALEAMTNQERDAYFKERVEASKKLGVIDPIDWTADPTAPESEPKPEIKPVTEPFTHEDLADAYRRLRRITRYPGSTSNLEMTPAGDRIIFRATGGAGGTTGIYSVKHDGTDEKRLSTAGSVQHVAANGSKVVLISSGRASTVPPAGGSEERINIVASIDLDNEALSLQKFHEMARTLGRTFYHPTMKDLDWETLTRDYADLARRAATSDEFNEIGNRLLGELNASHLGIMGGGGYSNPDFRPAGKLGIDASPLTLDDGSGAYRVDHVLPRVRTNAGDMRLIAGDLITAIELEPLKPTDTLDARLAGRAGVETIITVLRTGVVDSLNLLVTPVNLSEERAMRYDDWQLRGAAKVEELSAGRLGYLHIRAMGAPDLVEFERDLFAAGYGKEGLIIDVRSNGGGWTADRVMAALTYTEHAYTIPRGADPEAGRGYPRDRLFIQRYTGPVNMLCNQKSFSNAEIVSHAFKTLKRGTLVGQQTYGGVISTGAFSLVDGTTVRQPFRGWYLPDGTDMENNGAVPDIIVPQRAAEEAEGIDRQLEAAVADLLKRIDG
ncbi:MAG: PD40 domain-containing protein [Phycisphaeraceae bacterium]|nr:PD40 domain-containing protein [Phycisphaeraceae bacterium]MCW5763001.1 PD40 domain-containing protein [Phycisphaeraceae bacterium]